MRKRILCFLLSVLIVFGMIGMTSPKVYAASNMSASEDCIALIKKFEGFVSKPYYDYSQWSVGYGTKCPDEDLVRYQTYGISVAEADALLREHLKDSESDLNRFIDKYGLAPNQAQFDALLSFTYNLGSDWMNNESTFRSSVLNRATGNDFIFAIARWCNAGGKLLESLVRRRLAEANLYLNGVYSNTPPSHYRYVVFDNVLDGVVNDVKIQAFDSTTSDTIRAVASKSGYRFLGWYDAAQGGNRVTVLNSGTKVSKLYAHWETSSEESEEVIATGVVTADKLNIRAGAGTQHASLGYLYEGDTVEITEQKVSGDMTWGKIAQGWISLNYVKLTMVDTTEPETEPEQPTEPEQETEPEQPTEPEQETEPAEPSEPEQETEPEQPTEPEQETEPEEPTEPEQETEPEQPTEPEPEKKPENPKVIATGTVVNCNSLRIRAGVGTGTAQVGSLTRGARVEIYEKASVGSQVWGRISRGWICLTGYVKLDTDASVTGTTGKVVNCSALNIRSGPGTSYSKVGKLTGGASVAILETKQSNGTLWGRISQGWVSMNYIKLDQSGTTSSGNSNSSSNSSSSSSGQMTGTVRADVLRIRSGAGTQNAKVGSLTYGTRVTILETKVVGGTTWGRISKGWISLDYVTLDSAGSATVKTVTADCLNIRSGPGTSNSRVGTYTRGTRVTILETRMVGNTLWGRTDKGWISMSYVK